MKRSRIREVGLEGALLTLFPFPFVFISGGDLQLWQYVSASVSSAAALLTLLLVFLRPPYARYTAILSVTSAFGTAVPLMCYDPLWFFAGSVIYIFLIFRIIDHHSVMEKMEKPAYKLRSLQRVKWSAWAFIFNILFLQFMLRPENAYLLFSLIYVPFSVLIFLSWQYWNAALGKLYSFGIFLLIAAALLIGRQAGTEISGAFALATAMLILILLPRSIQRKRGKEEWLDLFISHPARLLFFSFLILCIAGTLLLSFGPASSSEPIRVIDAAFTSVSAVCVTGLIVLDTPNDFSFAGQLFILILIQLGGLGIMGITTVAMHSLGLRISLKHESMLSHITQSSHKDLLGSIRTILRFTFIAELAGAVLLFALFLQHGDEPATALWRGIFTAVSAFCNAGFALQTDSLLAYQGNIMVLQTVSTLIILGGLAPATALMLPAWLRRRRIPIPATIVLTTSFVLLISGAFFILVFEWDSALSGQTFFSKLNNAWFQSATLRTAGFNSIDISRTLDPSYLIMLVFMFIGGSPGGTAGGVKTTSFALIILSFWSHVNNRRQVELENHRIRQENITRAMTIVISGFLMWFLVVIMLATTQQIQARALIFEATSALATVGLSLGATPALDEIGKFIIIIAMFVGRIGPMTLFSLLSVGSGPAESRAPEVDITVN